MSEQLLICVKPFIDWSKWLLLIKITFLGFNMSDIMTIIIIVFADILIELKIEKYQKEREQREQQKQREQREQQKQREQREQQKQREQREQQKQLKQLTFREFYKLPVALPVDDNDDTNGSDKIPLCERCQNIKYLEIIY
jgi:flagellar biosynthesis component FlhA